MMIVAIVMLLFLVMVLDLAYRAPLVDEHERVVGPSTAELDGTFIQD